MKSFKNTLKAFKILTNKKCGKVTYKANLVFNNANALSSDGAAVGPNCHTNGTAYFYWDFLKGITCTGAAAGVAVDTTNTINSLCLCSCQSCDSTIDSDCTSSN